MCRVGRLTIDNVEDISSGKLEKRLVRGKGNDLPDVKRTMLRQIIFCLLSSLFALSAEHRLIIPNQLNHSWPGELVSFPAPGKLPEGDLTLEVQGEVRPAQRAGGAVWSYVSIANKDPEGKKLDVGEVPAILRTGKVAPGITVTEEKDFYLIDNGTYQFKLRNYDGKSEKAIPLAQFPHWCGGMKTKAQKTWDGNAYFESNAPVLGAKTEVVNQGPVFWDFKITYYFQQPEGGANPEVEAVPLALGKQAHLFEPNKIPRETIRGEHFHYELLLRFVMDDPWIDVNERFHFPKDEEASPFGITHYYLEWGKGGLPVDTVSWVRWFEYDSFGGNVDQKYVPAKPRPAQKGRPFALLRPRWNQGGGGAQDFLLTSGGEKGGPGNPAVGIVAAYASKWVGPYANYIPVYAHDGNRGRARFPLTDGERSGMHYGQRAWGLLVGPRSRFTSLNDVVRRHTDWTLTAQINKYVLDWKRDHRKAGPNIFATGSQLDQIRQDYLKGKMTTATRLLAEAGKEWQPLIDEREKLLADYREKEEALEKRIEDLKDQSRKKEAPKEIKTAYNEARNDLKLLQNEVKKNERLKAIKGKLKGTDYGLYQLLTTGEGPEVKPPSSHLWRERRYQDDFLNPTSSPTRRLPDYALADLFANGKPLGGADQAAMGYIATDLDAWPGWQQGWSPGNPNFHTDKYMAAMFVGGALRDHPHADEWLDYGFQNFKEDIGKVFLAPDGVGAECPGYSGYAMKLQLGIARVLLNTGAGNVIAKNPLVKGNARWHRKLITPYDVRIQRRHEAPIGDTHRWNSGLYASSFAKLASFFKESDQAFASELMGTARFLKESKKESAGKQAKESLMEDILAIDHDIEPMAVEKMDWSSESFEGFGAIMRDGFGTPDESFLSYKAGRARGHYHNDENSYHFYSGGTPISLDYNCSYTPRGDHAALHNTVTFGKRAMIDHNGRKEKVKTQEEITSSAKVLHFKTTEIADCVVSERVSDSLVMRPIDPGDHEFGRGYPTRKVAPLTHRRSLVFVKNKKSDYLVVRDECEGEENPQLNIHLLASEVERVEGGLLTFRATGQLDKDILVVIAGVENPEVEVGSWYYHDEWMTGPKEYIRRQGEDLQTWQKRLKGGKTPPKDWAPTWQDPKSDGAQDWFSSIRKTNGQALIIPPGWQESWMYGEYQKWLRIEAAAGSSLTWVLYPYPKNTVPPLVEAVEGGVKISREGESDEVTFGDSIEISRNGRKAELK